MTPHVTAGVDGSPESLAASCWAAREAVLRDVPLYLVHVEEWPTTPSVPLAFAPSTDVWSENLLRDAADQARKDHPGLEVVTRHVHGRAGEVLTVAANEADLTVLGSRGLGGIVGFLIGSVSLAVVAASTQPVVLVRREVGAPSPTPPAPRELDSGDVVLGLDIYQPCDPLIAFAFGEAARRPGTLHVLHSWALPASYGYAAITDPGIGVELERHASEGLTDMLRPWRSTFPGVQVTEKAVVGVAAGELLHAARGADLVVVGRHRRRPPLGSHIGHVAHAVIHHSPAPVAVVPFD
ncbi:universal stress protein [Streptomyces antnestii]|uniref:Universal stress protein n=1 Tax=Streptomyces antnestii TaxID=2494256 RepID=A0A437PKE0_9ACTN|nr:universal stress protein [Streptomyces sp. San01]RVU22736.1 universal stress protein [Streptomyces sp. San01]